MSRAGTLALSVLLFAWPAGSALAHAFGGRYDLPLPLHYYQLAAGLAVLLSFVVLARFMRPVTPAGGPVVEAARDGRTARTAGFGNTLAAFIYLFIVAAAMFGSPQVMRNIAPIFVWVWIWVGVAFAAALLGDIWKWLSPFPAFGRWIRARARRRLPAAIARWPAFVSFLAFAWLELVSGFGEQPFALGMLMLAYLAWILAGMWLFGVREWLEAADVFENVFGLFGRFGPLQFDANGAWRLRWPGTGLAVHEPVATSRTALVLALLATVSFDGLLETPAWLATTAWIENSPAWRPLLLAAHGAGIDLLAFVKTLALLVSVAGFAVAYTACVLLMRLCGGPEVTVRRLFNGFALTLVPIAVAYHLAHYLSYLATAGQQIVPLLSDPFGFGWNLFGTAEYRIRIGLVGPKAVWIFAAVAIVAGHVISVVLAHWQALRFYSTNRHAVLSQLPMIVLMVAYTMTSLWILSQPIVEAG